MTTETLKLHFENSSAKVYASVDEIVEAMNSDQKAHTFPNSNDVPVPVNVDNINWVQRPDR